MITAGNDRTAKFSELTTEMATANTDLKRIKTGISQASGKFTDFNTKFNQIIEVKDNLIKVTEDIKKESVKFKVLNEYVRTTFSTDLKNLVDDTRRETQSLTGQVAEVVNNAKNGFY